MNLKKVTKINRVGVVLFLGFSMLMFNLIPVLSENLQSTNFIIEDASITSGSEILNSNNYSLAGSIGEITSDDRLMSGSYEIKGGFPNGIIANVPKITCFETNTTSSTTTCISLINNKGMQGECGSPGCYNKAKIEIDSQNNPYDTLYLVKIGNLTDNTTHYLKSDHTLGLTYTTNNFLTKCAIEGKDLNNPNCNENGDAEWNSNLQSTNMFYLSDNTTYQASVSALNGDFTGTGFSSATSANTVMQSVGLDIDVGPTTEPNINNNAPYNINLSDISLLTATTSVNLVWLDMLSNNPKGFSIYTRDTNNGLFSSNKNATIPSENEDLSVDLNHNGGFGIKVYNGNTTETALGPLNKATGFNTINEDTVGSLSTTNKLLFFTNDSNGNKGEILNGRGAILIKARATATTPISSDYSDIIYFSIMGNY